MKILIPVIGSIAILLSFILFFGIYDSCTISKGMPLGYYLETDGCGNYRPCRDYGRPVFWFQEYGTKGQAMRRAWNQYEDEVTTKSRKWTKCDK